MTEYTVVLARTTEQAHASLPTDVLGFVKPLPFTLVLFSLSWSPEPQRKEANDIPVAPWSPHSWWEWKQLRQPDCLPIPSGTLTELLLEAAGVPICISPCLTFFPQKKKFFFLKSTHNTLGEFSRTSCRCYGYFHLIIILAIQHICNPCGKLWLTFLPVDAGQMQKPKRSVCWCGLFLLL